MLTHIYYIVSTVDSEDAIYRGYVCFGLRMIKLYFIERILHAIFSRLVLIAAFNVH